HLNKGGDLTLDEFKKRVTDKDLEKHGITPEEWKKYLADTERRMKNQQNAKNEDKNDLKVGDKAGDSRANSGVRQVKTDPNGKVGDIRVDGPAVAPPEYEDAGRRFNEMLANPRAKK